MSSFTDRHGKTWVLDITVADVKRVRNMCEVDLMATAEGETLTQLLTDPVLLVDVLYSVCKPQADMENIDDVAFGSSMSGDCIEEAAFAMLKAVIDFFPNPRDRANLQKALEQTQTLMDEARGMVETNLEEGVLLKEGRRVLEESGVASTKLGDASE